jgi:tRNA-binding protein
MRHIIGRVGAGGQRLATMTFRMPKSSFGRRSESAGSRQCRPSREIAGKQALFVVNLQPRKMRGVVSEGMLFDIGYADGVTPVLAVPESPVPDGARAG